MAERAISGLKSRTQADYVATEPRCPQRDFPSNATTNGDGSSRHGGIRGHLEEMSNTENRMAPRSNSVSARARSTTPRTDDGWDIGLRQASTSFERAVAFLCCDAQAKQQDYRSWDLGIMRLERISPPHGSAGARHRGILRASDGSCRRYARSGASAYLQQGKLPDLNFRILIAALDDGSSEQLLTASLPCALLKKPGQSLGREYMVPLASWQGAILADHLLSLARELPSIPKEHWPMLGAVAGTLVQACLAPAPGNSAETDTPRTTAVRERLRCIVSQNMTSPDFDADALRRLAAMSRSKLYRILKGTGGVARFIRDERLRAARHRLADVGDRTSIRTLAVEVGFLDHSTFSRAFKLRYGSSPTEFREMVSAHHPVGMHDVGRDADGGP